MANAKQLASGAWRVRVYVGTRDGVKKYKSFTANTKKKAELMALNYSNASSPEEVMAVQDTFETAMTSFLSLRSPVLSPATIRGYKSLENVLKSRYEDFCHLHCADIRDRDIQLVIDKISDTSTPKTVRNFSAFILSILREELPGKTYRVKLPQKVRTELYVPTDDEIKTIISGTENNPDLQIPILLAACCTLRRSEICALSIEDIKGDSIHIKRGKVLGADKKYYIKTTKTVSSDRYVQAPARVIEKIKFRGSITRYTPNALTDAFRACLDKLGIEHFRFHDLRHYSISVQHALGIPDAYIMQNSGHSSDYTLKNVYRHAMSDRRKEMNEKAISHFETLF